MRKLIKYMLEGDGSVPKFVEDGGYFRSGNEFVGISVDVLKRYVPDTVIRLTRAELLALVSSLVDHKGKKLTKKLAEELVTKFLAAKGLSDYE